MLLTVALLCREKQMRMYVILRICAESIPAIFDLKNGAIAVTVLLWTSLQLEGREFCV